MPRRAVRLEPETAAVLTTLASQAARLSGSDRASVLVPDDDAHGELLLAAAHGGLAVGDEHALAAHCLATGAPAHARDLGATADIEAAACVPLRTNGMVRGVLSLGAPGGTATLEPLDEVTRAMAHVLAQAETSRRLARTVQAGIEALASLLDLRDGYASRDAGEVADLACAVGRRLDVGEDMLRDLSIAGKLHDLGKIGVPDRILSKPGRLDPDERAIMERHSVWGAETLARIPGFDAIAEIVRSHHERWDGAGYPAGLAGEAIPLPARVIGACEAYRAMTSDRPYRGALAPARAVELLEQGAGSHFDPDVVESLVGVLRERGTADDPAVPPLAPGIPRGTATIPEPGGGERHALPRAFERLESLPALTESRDRLLALLRTPAPSPGAIVEAVEADIALVIAVLRLANRGRSGPSTGILSVRDAVEALTPEAVEQLGSRIATADFFDRRGGAWPLPAEPFRAHATAVQRAADRIAREVGHRDLDGLLVGATLHDVGQLVLAHAHPAYPAEVLRDANTPDERVRAERRALGVDHALVGGVLLRRWGLPGRLARAVERHHSDDDDAEPALLRLADMLAHYTHGRPIDPHRLLESARRVGLSTSQLRTVMFELPTAGAAKRRSSEPCPLTDKELQSLRGLAAGKVYKEIAVDLGIATSTVRSHLHKTYKKVGASDRAQAVLIATERGWL
jgi:putative nucleotidyltransferase with HDIG domain